MVGRPWSDRDIDTLEHSLHYHHSIATIASTLGRTEHAVIHRMKTILYDKHKAGESLDKYYWDWPVTKDEMIAFINSGGAYHSETRKAVRVVSPDKKDEERNLALDRIDGEIKHSLQQLANVKEIIDRETKACLEDLANLEARFPTSDK